MRAMQLLSRLSMSTLLVASACGSEPPPKPVVPPPPKKIEPPPKPIEGPAKWIFPDTGFGVRAKADLGAAGTLYVGESGRRGLATSADGNMMHAQTLAPSTLVGAMADPGTPGQVLLVGDEGDVYLAKEPLGPIVGTRKGPAIESPKVWSYYYRKVRQVATGKKSIALVAHDGVVHRSGDGGQTWSKVDYAVGSKFPLHAVGIALDANGKGLLMALPQRLFVTSDDGATWSAMASPSVGFSDMGRDGDGRIWIHGAGGRARWDGTAFVTGAAAGTPTKLWVEPSSKGGPSEGDERDWTLTHLGDRVGRLVAKASSVSIEIGKMGEAPKTHKLPELEGEQLRLDQPLAGHGEDLLVARADDDSNTTLLESKDGGATWGEGESITGIRPRWEDGPGLVVGPKGWAYVGALCPENDWSGSKCGHRRVRPAGSKAFEELAAVDELSPKAFAFDASHDKVYAVAIAKNQLGLYESKLGENKFTRTKLFEGVKGEHSIALTVDPSGTVRALTTNYDHWILRKLSADGTVQPVPYLAKGR